MNEQQKIYAPINAKQITFQASGKTILKLGINVEKFKAWLDEHKNEKGYVNLGVSARNQASQYGETHTVWLDTWNPNQSEQPVQPRRPQVETAPATPRDDDVPF